MKNLIIKTNISKKLYNTKKMKYGVRYLFAFFIYIKKIIMFLILRIWAKILL